MIAGCPTCGARYRIDTGKLRPEGARLRCSRCETVFRVRPPQAQPDARPAAPSAAEVPTEPRVERPAQVPPSRPRAPEPAPPPDPERLVLVAHPEVAAGKALAEAVASWGLAPLLVHDGVEAILHIQRSLPRVVVLDAALPKMFGFQVCELMKRNEQLCAIPVVLVGAIHDQERYRRPPEEIYGADAYVERHQLPDALRELVARFGLPLGGATPARPAPSAPAPQRPEPAAPARPAPQPAAPARATPSAPSAPEASASPEVAKGERLARIIVSDVILYNAEKFDAGVRAGNVVDALASELEEGYALFAQRVDTSVCDPREFLQRELQRVARSRGMK